MIQPAPLRPSVPWLAPPAMPSGPRSRAPFAALSRFARAALLASLFASVSACAHYIPVVTPDPLPRFPHAPSSVQVGVARADVTMPPGVSTFGHAIDARVADGYWTRTYCRVFYFETAAGQKLAIVPCELAAMSILLQRAVAERVSDLLHPAQLMMTAVHTHAATAHFFGNSQYTALFSSRHPGFDEELLKTLADRIAAAVRAAEASKRAAALRWYHGEDLWCLSRNRSLEAHRLNHDRYVPQAPDPWPCEGERREDYQAIDPALHVLRIDARDPASPGAIGDPIGSLSLFAMHPTVVRATNQLIGGDLHAIVYRHVERQLRREWLARHPECVDAPADACSARPGACTPPDPLHGILNTNEGDIAPAWTRGNVEEAIQLGQRLADRVWRRHPGVCEREGRCAPIAPVSEPILDLRYVEDDIRGAKLHTRDGTPAYTCEEPRLGQAASRGGSDHPTSVAWAPMFVNDPAVDYADRSCQAPKRPLLGPVSDLAISEGSFPAKLPLAVARLDDTLIAFLPAELTVNAGFRVRRRMLDAVARYPGAPRQAVIAGLANEYIQYVATREEYQLQSYEGASTLYGANSAGYLANRSAQLARSLFDPSHDGDLPTLGKAGDIPYAFGPSRARMPARDDDDDATRRAEGLCQMPSEGTRPRFCFYFSERSPGDVPLTPAPWIRLVRSGPADPLRLCLGEAGVCDPQGFVDDRGFELETRIHAEVGDGWVWSTLFSPSEPTWQEIVGQPLRIAVGCAADALVSDSFGVARPGEPGQHAPACTVQEARLCLSGHRTEQWDGLVSAD